MRISDLEAVFASNLPCVERMVMLAIAKHANNPGDKAWPSIDTIARLGGMSESTAVRAIAKLKSKGWLNVRKRFGLSAVYEIRLPQSPSIGGAPELSVQSASIGGAPELSVQSASIGGAPELAERQPSIGGAPASVLAERLPNHPERSHPSKSARRESAPVPLSKTRMGILELNTIPGLKTIPKDRDKLIEVLNDVGMDIMKAATKESLTKHGTAWEDQVTPIAYRLRAEANQPRRSPAAEWPDDLHDATPDHPDYENIQRALGPKRRGQVFPSANTVAVVSQELISQAGPTSESTETRSSA